MVEFNRNHNAKVRAAAFQWLSGLVSIHGDTVPRAVLEKGFELDG